MPRPNHIQLTGLALNFEGPAVPEWVQLVPAGPAVEGRDGRRWVMPNPEAIVAAFVARGADLPIDYEHATQIKGGAGERADAIGWIGALEARAGSIWGRVDWTEEGKATVASRAYRYLSPVFRFDRETGAILELLSAGLTNNPNLHLAALNAAQEEKDDTVDKVILEALGLAANATAADAVVAIGTLKSARDVALNSAQHPDPEKFVPKADHQLALNRIGEFEAADKVRRDAEIVATVEAAIVAGKIAPASKDHYLALCRAEGGFEPMRTLIAGLPSLVGSTRASDRRDAPGAGAAGLDAEELAMCRAFEMKPEDFASAKSARE